MKFKLFVLVLTLSLIVWAQGIPQSSSNSTPAPEAKASCCQHSDMKDGKGCCHHSSSEKTDAMACCGDDKPGAMSCSKKDMKACMEQCKKEGKNCCSDGKCGKDAKSCCGSSGDKTSANCCGGTSCERHQHAS